MNKRDMHIADLIVYKKNDKYISVKNRYGNNNVRFTEIEILKYLLAE
jgi:hypothetical protein